MTCTPDCESSVGLHSHDDTDAALCVDCDDGRTLATGIAYGPSGDEAPLCDECQTADGTVAA